MMLAARFPLSAMALAAAALLSSPARADAPPAAPGPAPDKLPYHAEQPDPPPGYRMAREPRAGVLAAGSVIFWADYTLNVIGGIAGASGGNADKNHFALLGIPLVGPFIFAGVHHAETGFFPDLTVPVFVLDGLVQLGGFTLMAAGLLAKRPVWVRAGASSVDDGRPLWPGLATGAFALVLAGSGLGLVLSRSSEAASLQAAIDELGVLCGRDASPYYACSALKDQVSRQVDGQNAGLILLFSGAALGAAASAYLLWPRGSRAAPVQAAPAVVPGGGGLWLQGSF